MERSIVKVRVKNAIPTTGTVPNINVDGIGETTLYPLYNPENKANKEQVGSTDVYVAFAGWQVTNDAATSYLVKSINTTWTDENLGFVWNLPAYHRCYWAANPDFGTITGADLYNGLKHYTWNDNVATTDAFYTTGNDNVRYCQENADEGESKSDKRNTQVLVKGILVDNTGAPLTICEWLGNRYASKNDLKTQILNNLKASESLNYYRLAVEGDDAYVAGETKYTQMTIDDLDFITASAAEGSNNDKTDLNVTGKTGSTYKLDESERYNVCLTLVDAAGKGKNAVWYQKVGDEVNTTTPLTNTTINAAFAKINSRIYESGMTYYFFDIKHLGSTGKTAEYGVVRNHIYDCTIDGVYGLGTPVYDPNEVIIPETVTETNKFMAARINVLSWRVVANNYTLGDK